MENFVRSNWKVGEREPSELREFTQLVVTIYQMDRANIDNVRSTFLESYIWRSGPIKIDSNNYKKYKEPFIRWENEIVGGSQHRMDIVFHATNTNILFEEAEYVECKSNIESLIVNAENIEALQQKKKDKLKYMMNIYNTISDKLFPPYIIVACYNKNISPYQEYLSKWGIGFISIIGGKELVSIYGTRKHRI